MGDLVNYWLDEVDKRAERAGLRVGRIDAALADIKAQQARTATGGELWGAVATMVGAGLGVIVAILTYLQVFPHPH